jgi:hypothetical protein
VETLENTADTATEQTGSNLALDQIEAEAAAMTAAPAADQPGADPQPGSPDEPEEKKPFQQPAGAFEATHEIIVGGIKVALKKYPGGDKMGAVWESPLFKQAVIPVMQKYNISLYNFPAELVLLGVIVMLAKQTVDIMRAAKADGQAPA